MKKVKKKKLGIVGVKPAGAFDPNRKYRLLEECLYDHDSWYSTHADNQGNTPSDTPDGNGVKHWERGTNGGKHAYEEGESAKAKGNTAKAKGDEAEVKGNNAEFYARAARLMAENPPKVGKTIAGHDADDNYWWAFIPNADYTDGTYVNTGVWSKGEELDFESLTEEQKQEIANAIIALLVEVSEEDAESVFSDYVFQTTD